MTLQTTTMAGAKSELLPIFMAALFGLAIIVAETLHDAAHDTRHATGFPCH